MEQPGYMWEGEEAPLDMPPGKMWPLLGLEIIWSEPQKKFEITSKEVTSFMLGNHMIYTTKEIWNNLQIAFS